MEFGVSEKRQTTSGRKRRRIIANPFVVIKTRSYAFVECQRCTIVDYCNEFYI